MSVESIYKKLGARAAAIQYPIGIESQLKGVIDIIDMKGYIYADAKGENAQIVDVPAEYAEKVEELRMVLFEKLAEFDEDIMMKILEDETPTTEEIKNAIRKGVLTCEFFPVLCGSA